MAGLFSNKLCHYVMYVDFYSEVVAEPAADEPKEMTLDEWKAAQTKTKAEFKVRKANEGTDTKQWKGTVALQRKKKGDMSEDEYEEESEDEEQVRLIPAAMSSVLCFLLWLLNYEIILNIYTSPILVIFPNSVIVTINVSY